MFIGVVIIVVGLLFFLEAIVPGFQVNFRLVWPCILFVMSLYFMWRKKKIDIFSSFLFLVSIWCFLYYFGWITIRLTDVFWPLFIIFIGFSMIANAILFKIGGKSKKIKTTEKGFLQYYGIFSGIEEKIVTKDFKGATLYAIFGGIDLDLREMDIKEDTIIEGYAIFGGIDLIVSDTYNVVVQGSAFFGGNENKVKNKMDESRPTLYIRPFSVFGGTSIK
ncbi:MAG: hypothetical protein PHN72_00245 [Bacilli bacterium]|nr:hypothetical protein [Bacilli bacterium]